MIVDTSSRFAKLAYWDFSDVSKRILIVTYGFPPSNTIPVHRILRLSKWLPRYGWEPTILTVKTKFAHPYFYANQDEGLESLVPKGMSVHRASSFEHVKHPFFGKVQARIMGALAIPDPYVTWLPGALRKGKAIIDEQGIDVVLTTLGPNSTALIGYFLKKLTSTKWVMDYRDPWSLNSFKQLGRIRYAIEKKIEDVMLSQSDANVTTSRLITETYCEHYPQLADRFSTITNCFDRDLQFLTESTDIGSSPDQKFRLVHAGSFYGKRTPTNFLAALDYLVRKHPGIQSKIEILFVGELTDDFRKEISATSQNLSIDCRMIGAVTYKKSMRYMSGSDLLLAINGMEDRHNIFIPGKLFDYIAANKPILLIGHRGAASEIIEDGDLGAVRSPEDIDGIGCDILRYYRRWEQCIPFEPNTSHIKKYHASKVAEQLAEILDSVVFSAK